MPGGMALCVRMCGSHDVVMWWPWHAEIVLLCGSYGVVARLRYGSVVYLYHVLPVTDGQRADRRPGPLPLVTIQNINMPPTPGVLVIDILTEYMTLFKIIYCHDAFKKLFTVYPVDEHFSI